MLTLRLALEIPAMRTVISIVISLSFLFTVRAQSIKEVIVNEGKIAEFITPDGTSIKPSNIPVVSFEINNAKLSTESEPNKQKIKVQFGSAPDTLGTKRWIIHFINQSSDTIELHNVVPFGTNPKHVYITGLGDHGLSRTHLFIPGKIPVNVICPDNAWELGYTGMSIDNKINIAALVRRDRESVRKGYRKRFETVLFPGGSVRYFLYAEVYQGQWQEGLKRIFREKFLYDVASFDNELFDRKDLQWIRHSYVMHLMMAWNNSFYDGQTGKYTLLQFLDNGKKLYGGDDVIGIWPTWPSLGLDQRNQFDLFRDLPGGTKQIKKLASESRNRGTRFFICYNPWDESTRNEGHLAGLADLIEKTDADGVVLDTRGASSKELQNAADKVKKGVVMYSEGMAIVKDMPSIVAGRVHNALYYPPLLNLNKFIKPEFAIFRVAELFKEPIRREFATSFFNGYGTELNIFAPGNPPWIVEQYKYLGKTSRILRENSYNFTSKNYVPLIPVTADSIWVNEWQHSGKTIYTVFSTIPQGYKGKLFEVKTEDKYHFIDLWHHEKIQPQQINGKWMIEARTDAFNAEWIGTNNEGEVDCIAKLPVLLQSTISENIIKVQVTGQGTILKIWHGAPDYKTEPYQFKLPDHGANIEYNIGRYEGKVVIQLFDDNILLDEDIVNVLPGAPRKISAVVATSKAQKVPDTRDMVTIPAGTFIFRESHGDAFIPYPRQNVDSTFDIPSFYMDKFPVTNHQFNLFLRATGYKPADTVNFLKHWNKGKMPAWVSDHPVIYVSYEDVQAYCKWAGKRLPTEIEWQYAAQTSKLNEWPWQQKTPVKRMDQRITETLTVSAIEGIDSSFANLGDGKLYPVGKYPKGVNPFGLHDLVGSVWQMTNDIYQTGSYRYIILKGGSYFKPSSSWWYVQGGPRELHYRQFLLQVSPGFERNATVGFRCMRDK